jgi:large subunit ribosomal protein L21
MFAVFEDGSRQYRVSEGDVVTVDYRAGEKGTRVEFPRVLLYQGTDDLCIGQPVVEGVRVLGEVTEQTSIKLYIQKFRRRKNYRRLRGHRQPYTRVQIRYILLPGQEPPPPPPAATETPAATTPQPPAPAPTEAPGVTPPSQPAGEPPTPPAPTA